MGLLHQARQHIGAWRGQSLLFISMILVSNRNYTTYENDIRPLLQSFFPGAKICAAGEETPRPDTVRVDVDAVCEGCSRSSDRFLDKSYIKRALYQHLSGLTGRTLPWGTLTGIRPVRIVEMMLAKGMDPALTLVEARPTRISLS